MAIKSDVLNRMTLAEIEKGLTERRELVNQMVGSLYPAILLDEMDQLQERKYEIEQVLRNEGYEV